MASSQIIHNPDLREGHLLKGWFEHDGQNMDFHGYKNDGMGGGGGGEGFSLDFDLVLKLRHIHHVNIFCDSVLSEGIFIHKKVSLKNLINCKDKSSKNLFDRLRLLIDQNICI